MQQCFRRMVGGHEDDPLRRAAPMQFSQYIQAVHMRHPYVEQNYVELVTGKPLQTFESAGGPYRGQQADERAQTTTIYIQNTGQVENKVETRNNGWARG